MVLVVAVTATSTQSAMAAAGNHREAVVEARSGGIKACHLLTRQMALSLDASVNVAQPEQDNSVGSLCEFTASYNNNASSKFDDVVLQIGPIRTSWTAMLAIGKKELSHLSEYGDIRASNYSVPKLGARAEASIEVKVGGGTAQGVIWEQGGLLFQLNRQSFGRAEPTTNYMNEVIADARRIAAGV